MYIEQFDKKGTNPRMTEVTQTHLAQNANDHGIFGLEPITKCNG